MPSSYHEPMAGLHSHASFQLQGDFCDCTYGPTIELTNVCVTSLKDLAHLCKQLYFLTLFILLTHAALLAEALYFPDAL